MPRKVIIDCDPGIDDAVALTLALFDPRLEVVAVTAVAGNVPAERATLNVQAIIERLDPPRYPRIGSATAAEDIPYIWLYHTQISVVAAPTLVNVVNYTLPTGQKGIELQGGSHPLYQIWRRS